MDDSGGKALSWLRTVFDIVRPAEIDALPIFGVNNSNSQLRWGFNIYSFIRSNLKTSGRSLLWFTTKRLTFQELSSKRSLQNSEAFYHRVQTKTSELTENSTYWPITENTHFVQLLIAYPNKSAASNSTFICFESSLLLFSTRWMVVSRVLLAYSVWVVSFWWSVKFHLRHQNLS